MDRLQSKQILLIADAHPENVDVLKTILSPGFDNKVATDAQETIQLASSPDTPALILLNIKTSTVDMLSDCESDN
jgi:CheY-like chemotaxis protein